MDLVIFGSTGPTGRLLVEQALEQGHAVTAVARNPTDLKTTHPALNILKGDIRHRDSVDSAIKGHEAVISALGVTSDANGGGTRLSSFLILTHRCGGGTLCGMACHGPSGLSPARD